LSSWTNSSLKSIYRKSAKSFIVAKSTTDLKNLLKNDLRFVIRMVRSTGKSWSSLPNGGTSPWRSRYSISLSLLQTIGIHATRGPSDLFSRVNFEGTIMLSNA
jgi:hypothetical protein